MQYYFEKVADRAAWDFALLSISAAFRMEGDVIRAARLVLGAAACVPYRLEAVEKALAGTRRDAATADRVATLESARGEDLELQPVQGAADGESHRRAVRGG